MTNDNLLYQYKSIDKRTIEELLGNKIRATVPTYFNDPYDCSIHNSLDDEIYRELIEEHIKSKTITCFSKKNDILQQWIHYANKYKGICVGYDKNYFNSKSEIDETISSNILLDIEYIPNDQEIEIDLSELINQDTRWQAIDRLLTQRSNMWSYQEECRWILRHKSTQHEFFHDIKGRYHKFRSNDIIKEIIFGTKTLQSDKELIMNTAKLLNPDIKFFQAKTRTQNFGLDIVPIYN